MSIIKKMIEALGKNQSNISAIQGFKFMDVINQHTGAMIALDKEYIEMPIGKDEEEFWSITFASEIAGLSVLDGMDSEEKKLTEKCLEMNDILGDKKIPFEQRNRALKEFKKTYRELNKARKVYDKSLEYSDNVSDKAKWIFRKCCHTQYYSDNSSKRTYKKLDKGMAGVEDKFYDEFKKIYGEEGLKGYRRENMEKFKSISYSDVQLAAQRYQKEESLISKAKTLIEIPFLFAAFQIFPNIASVNPVIYGLGLHVLSSIVLGMGADARSIRNREIFDARCRIAKELGFKKKLFLGMDAANSYRYDYDWADREEGKNSLEK